MSRVATAGTPALRVLRQAGIEHAVHAYVHDPRGPLGYGQEAAAALDVDPGRVFKTLVVAVDDALVVAVLPVDHQLDLKALAATAGGRRAVLAEPQVARRATGYVPGGISPIGQRQRLAVVLDDGALGHRTIYISAGRRGLEVELAPQDLVTLTSATTGAVARRTVRR